MSRHFICAALACCLSANATNPHPHDLRLSVCEIEYLPAKNCFELRFFLFADDFRLGIYGDPLHDSLLPKDAVHYLVEHFLMRFDGEKILVKYKKIMEKAGQTQVRFQTEVVDALPARITIDNTILLREFPAQINMHFLLIPGQSRRSLLLKKGKTRGSFEL